MGLAASAVGGGARLEVVRVEKSDAWGQPPALREVLLANTSGLGGPVPPEVARAGFSVAAALGGGVWALAHGLPHLAGLEALIFVAAVVIPLLTAAVIGLAFNPPEGSDLLTAVAVVIWTVLFFAWLVLRLAMGRHGNVWAWQRRYFNSVAEFRAAQRAWLVGEALTVIGAAIIVVLILGSGEVPGGVRGT